MPPLSPSAFIASCKEGKSSAKICPLTEPTENPVSAFENPCNPHPTHIATRTVAQIKPVILTIINPIFLLPMLLLCSKRDL